MIPRQELYERFCDTFDRGDVTADNIKSLCWRRGWKAGSTGRFAPGQVPANKGRFGYCPPGCEKGWFKKGGRSGQAARNYKPIGTERISRDGYRERKIHDGLPLQSRWRAGHLIEWEAVNGPLPPGMCLRMVGDDKFDTAPSNWEPVSRAVNLYLNSRWVRLKLADAERETRPTLLTAAKLRCRASERRRERKPA